MILHTNKRGISPLIATVLIIGFTVALAAVVMTWGSGFVRETTESTSEQATSAIECARLNLEVNIKPDCSDVFVVNNGATDLTDIKIRIDDELQVPTTEPNPIDSLESLALSTMGLSVTNGQVIEAIPVLGETTCIEARRAKTASCTV